MPLPKLNIIFETSAEIIAARSNRGVVAVILKDATATGGFEARSMEDVPEGLTAENKAHIARIFTGASTAPEKVVGYVAAVAGNMADARAYLEKQDFDYMVLWPTATSEDTADFVAWITNQRENYDKKYKAVLPNTTADKPYIINVADSYDNMSAGECCARVAGIICGTPLTQSITYAALPEATEATKRTKAEANTMIDAGKLIFVEEGGKIRIARECNSLTTMAGAYNNSAWKSIMVVDTMDIMRQDLRNLIVDNFIGKYKNNLNNRMLLVAAVQAYFESLEAQSILEAGLSTCEIDVDAMRRYLREHGTDDSKMSDDEVRAAKTGKSVYLKAKVAIFEAVEDIEIRVGV